jgi:ferritin-like metal-binding protein YciE
MAVHLQTPQELFFYDLCSMYDIEQKLVPMLSELAQESSSKEVKSAFMEHQRETEQHVHNLEQCFQMLKRTPLKMENKMLEGMQLDHNALVQQQPSPQVLTLANIGAGSKSEYLEMAAYHCLIDAANALGLQSCVPLFEQNLRQEEAAAQKLATLGHQLGRQQTQHA